MMRLLSAMNSWNPRFFCLAFVASLLICAASARAIVVGDPQPYNASPPPVGLTPGPTGTTPPTVVDSNGDNLGGNVGTVNGDSCIYIGNGWVLTAYHVGSGNASFSGLSGQTFTYDGTNHVQLTTPGTMPGTSTPADLYMFRLTTDPALPNMALSNMSGSDLAKSGNPVTMCGYGRTVVANSFSDYDTSQNPYKPTTSATGEGGYSTTGTSMFRWGTNNLLNPQTEDVNDGYGTNTSIITRFNPNYGGYAQASFGDSGGAMFGKVADGSYALVGMIYAIGDNVAEDESNSIPQPSNDTAAFSLGSPDGNGTNTSDSTTYSADISAYMSEIESIIAVPEPATGWVAVLVAGALYGAWRRRSGRRAVR